MNVLAVSLIISPCNSICFSTGLLVDTNLDTSVPDTYTPPPTPIPYETYVGRPPTPSRNRESSENKSEVALQTANIESIQDTNAGSTFETKNMIQRTQKCSQNVITIFTLLVFLNGWKEVIPVQCAISAKNDVSLCWMQEIVFSPAIGG
ncbi:hypothetical protein BUALT_Bualt07G0116800 [Buddleja alternifolia]|uniref:Uncharacterized protein n=1 Tax=Buddleja alternifolia TaxID=168488 RepID=A0AAV6XKM2_9LAMI|nr:hypothetical protein BUALT_Bualt07G0116800 [Buddleja alternifolia]